MSNERLLKNIELKPEEEIRDVVRQSIGSHFWPIFLAIVLILIAFFLIYPLFRLGWWGVAGFVVLLVLGFLVLARTYASYYFTTFIMTSARIIDVFQQGFFNQTVSEALYNKIQDVSYKRKGIVNAILGTGDIFIDFLGAGRKKTRLRLKSIKNPQAVVNEIMSLQESFLEDTGGASEAQYLLNKIKRKIGQEAFDKLIKD